ncbi:MAG: site-specific DNA-methyltransferase [Leptospira sp.]|nr:site-specific DNA-methyltransferase [Leptospira sp.]
MSAQPKLKKKEERIQVGEFWTAKQRQAHPIHYTISYRASFKPELPSFFFREFLYKKNSVVFDPFGGRGTTAIQANLEGHRAIHNDVNPVSVFLAKSRKIIPTMEKLERKLDSIDLKKPCRESVMDKSLLNFFHPDTLREIKNLMELGASDDTPELDYLRLTALSRLHGHSTGFFSVYTFPQFSISPEAQRRNNLKRGLVPEYRPIKPRISGKMKRDLSDPLPPFYHEYSKNNLYTNSSSVSIDDAPDSVADLAVTSPPFLDKVNYGQDNWMKSWFLGVKEEEAEKITMFPGVENWRNFISKTLIESSRILRKNAYFVMEVGEVKCGKEIVNLDEEVISASRDTNFEWEKTYINTQKFTKLSNCWSVANNEKGTNSNRCVVFRNRK